MYIRELAKNTGVSIRLLRYYEAAGLLTAKRMPNGYRINIETLIKDKGLRQQVLGRNIAKLLQL